jgi:hypothetical protein
MDETATAETVPTREPAGVNIGEFHLDASSGQGWTYRMYLLDDDCVRVNRVYPDPENGRGIAEARNLSRYEDKGAVFSFPSSWEGNGNAERAEAQIVRAHRRATMVTVASSIRFGDLVLVMTADPQAGVIRVEEEPEGATPRWAATLSALHRDYMSVQISWSAPDFGHVFGTNPEDNPGWSNRRRLARAGLALWRSVSRDRISVPRQARTDDTNELGDLLNG